MFGLGDPTRSREDAEGSLPARNEPLLPRSASFGAHKSRLDMLKDAWAHYSPSAQLLRVCASEVSAVKTACVSAAVACLTIGFLGVLNPFSVVSLLHYLTCLYLVACASLAVVMEVDAPLFEPLRRWVGCWVRGLTRLRGRGVLYIVIGMQTAGLGDPLAVASGLLSLGAGAACFVSLPSRETADAHAGELPEQAGSPDGEVPRIAFRRRVLFGMERMDSSELVALSLELGLRLDARARAAALAMLDPHQDGSIEEETFIVWFQQQQQAQPPLLPP
uniref:Uncharacterized protein n=1 Tax=Haptolina brevifila TaxID=156173 RepID=A0A7S2BJ92_9EUKA